MKHPDDDGRELFNVDGDGNKTPFSDDQRMLHFNFLKVEYQYKRKPEYPSLEEQLDLLWHAIDKGNLNKTSDFYKKLKVVKENNPKPE
tara:strand:- start:78 stop:341 length:264 start_codon:yes stop_codon:yes gene_type:complete